MNLRARRRLRRSSLGDQLAEAERQDIGNARLPALDVRAREAPPVAVNGFGK
jgi:hypothetical protein